MLKILRNMTKKLKSKISWKNKNYSKKFKITELLRRKIFLNNNS